MKKTERLGAYASLCASMLIFGSIGIFRKYLPVPSGFLALSRAVIGTLFLGILIFIFKKSFSVQTVRRNLLKLCISGALLGINWILLFEAYEHTSVSVATLCYYMAPVFIIIVSPFILKERLTLKKAICAAGSLFGMVLVSGVITGGLPEGENFTGIMLGLASAVFYASVVIMNKKLFELSPYDKTFVQLAAAAVVMIPYVIFAEDVSSVDFNITTVVMLAVVGVIHTGIAYALYFGALRVTSAQSAALCSYIDPASALVLSAVILEERLDVYGMIGAALILAFAALGELSFKKKGFAKEGTDE